jgi:hypothetical protein
MAVIAPLVGAAVGGWAATAMNAAWIAGTWQYAVGTMVGSMLGSMMFPPAMPGQTGPRAQDGMVQVSTYGASIPIVYGTMALSGNVIWSAGLREVKVRTKVGSGKSKTKVTTYSYYCDFAVGLCEGEINCVRRVWLDSDLVYDLTSVDPKVIAANTKFENIMTVYRGSETQLADPVIEAVIGAGDTPAFRGLAYLVFDNLPLQNYGNRIPNVRVELVRADMYYTSEPYPIHVLESLTSGAAWTGAASWMPPDDSLDAACALTAGALTVTVSYGSYGNYGAIPGALGYEHSGMEAEWLECAADCTGGALTVTVSYGSYTNWPAESLECAADCTGGSMAVTAGYVSYDNYAAESLESSCALVSGSLT